MARIIRVDESTARQRLADVPDEKRFWVTDGRVLRNLKELASALRSMSDEVYTFHAGDSRNDFSNWVRDVIGDNKLSNDLVKSNSPAKAAKAVEERVAWLEQKL